MTPSRFRRTWSIDEMVRLYFPLRGHLLALLWRVTGPSELDDYYAFRSEFEARIDGRWQDGLDLLELVRFRSIEAAEAIRDAPPNPDADQDDDDLLFEVLLRLHARSALVTSEILALLRTGHADGAMARWRTLHEIAVTMHFIVDHGHDVAARYVDHLKVRSFKAALQHNQFADRLGMVPLDAGELEELTEARNAVVAQYGSPFGREYGWAAHALGRDRVTFVDIESATNFDSTRPWYRLASEGQHAGPHGIYYSLATIGHDEGLMLAGPTDAGLETAGAYTAIRLVTATTAVLRLNHSLESVASMIALDELAMQTEDAFNAAATQLEEEVHERREGERT